MTNENEKQELIKSHGLQTTNYELIKVENDMISAMAVMRPRNNAAVLAELTEQIQTYPSFAEAVVYSKPVGTGKDGRPVYARGLSIRAAEAIAAAWGYNRISQSVEPIDDDTVKVTAQFLDIQTGRVWTDSGIVSKFYKKSGGGVARHSEDRFYSVVVKAEMSRRIREAIIRCVPPGLRSELQLIAEKAVAKLLTNEAVERIVGSFGAIGVQLVQIEKLLGKPIHKGWTLDDRTTLLQVYNAIKDGETTVAEVFGSLSSPSDATKAKPSSLGAAIETETIKE
jgi:hypothetical protein